MENQEMSTRNGQISFIESFIPDKKLREEVLLEAASVVVGLTGFTKLTLSEAMRLITGWDMRIETKLYLVYTLSRNAGIEHVRDRIVAEDDVMLGYFKGVGIPLVPYEDRQFINPVINEN